MKRLLAGLALVSLLNSAAYAANSCTAKTDLPISLYGATEVTPVECTIDTVDTDVTAFTPDSTKMGALIGISYAEGTAHNVKFTEGTDPQMMLEMGANGGIVKGIGEGMIFVSQIGNAIKFQSSAAITGPMILYFIQAERFHPVTK